jgi:uncharacterized protein (TIGR02145 family)
MPEGDLSVVAGFHRTPTDTYDPGVVINGVKWATRNVDRPATFVSTPENYGMYYQWGRKRAWSSTDPMKAMDENGEIAEATWDKTNEPGDIWLAENDPSPEGWRLPTTSDIEKLSDREKVDIAWSTSPRGYTFTDKTTGKVLFLPASGYRSYLAGGLISLDTHGYYWLSTSSIASYACRIYFDNDGVDTTSDSFRSYGYCVRSVAAE